MTRPQHKRLLAHAADRAKARPAYMGWVLARYIEHERTSEGELAQRLGIAGHDFPHLALCLRPRADHFAADIRQISSRFNIDPAGLAGVVRFVQSVETLAHQDAGGASAELGLLMAARARKQRRPAKDGESHDDDHPRS